MNRNHFFNKDIVFSTIFVFLCVWLLKYSFVHLEALNPVEKALSDFDYGDLVFKYRKQHLQPNANSPIVIVEIGRTRAEIAREVNVINEHHPKLLALDAWFAEPHEPEVDSVLIDALSHSQNLVLGSYLQPDSTGNLQVHQSFPAISRLGKNAYLNFVGEYEKTIRYFKPTETVERQLTNSFPAEIIQQIDSAKYNTLVKRNNTLEFINYTKTSVQFIPTLSLDDIKPDNPALDVLKGKIVILGKVDDNNLEDLHFTPFNNELAGRSKPDMSGVFIHGNILEMIMAGNYVNHVPDYIIFIISIFLAYLNIIFHVFYFVEKHIWYHLFAKILQLVFLVVLVFAKLQLLKSSNIVFDENIVAVPVILAVDLLYFYDAIVKWMSKHFGYESYFSKHRK